ncbi:hypothetical protein FALBO_9682 [Fusarium albosuccineum]|uniref:Uncharacterized protein n=1 Tax=Fusarium albosuccineum TaxID=1237068 RepID=A0A8H4L9C9_9HYPO|nr:hypothetical protein FALBO_9682 [Fusarium albosuccineum]
MEFGQSARAPVVCVTYRASSPNLRPLPLESVHRFLPEALERHHEDFVSKAYDVLENYNLLGETSDVEFLYRQHQGRPRTAAPTLYIITPWTQNAFETWPQAVQDIKEYVDSIIRGLDEGAIDVHVEMIAPERVLPKFMAPVNDHQELVSKWNNLRSTIAHHLNGNEAVGPHWTTIALFRLGYSQVFEENPITVYISLDYRSDETKWDNAIVELKKLLRQMGWDFLQVHMEHGLIDATTFPLLTPSGDAQDIIAGGVGWRFFIKGDYQDKINLGDSISASLYNTKSDGTQANPLSGTLGAFVEIKTKANPEWTKYGITNYHVIRSCFDGFTGHNTPPAEGSQLSEIDEDGFWPNKCPGPVVMESPARASHNQTIWLLDQEIATLERRMKALNGPSRSSDQVAKEKLEQERAAKIAFFDQGRQILGKVYAASGYKRRTSDNGRLDWALIDVISSRQGENRLPYRETWEEKYETQHHPNPDSFASLLVKDSLSPYLRSGNGWKVGTTTGATSGWYSRSKPSCAMSDDKRLGMRPSYERVFVGRPQKATRDEKFCRPGDSGAIVFDADGQATGLLFRGKKIQQNTQGYGLVTPLGWVFDDIEAFSKGQITDIRIARA